MNFWGTLSLVGFLWHDWVTCCLLITYGGQRATLHPHMGSWTPTQVVWLGDNLAGVQVLCLILIIFCGLFQGSSSAGQRIYCIHEHSSTQMGKVKGQPRALEPPLKMGLVWGC